MSHLEADQSVSHWLVPVIALGEVGKGGGTHPLQEAITAEEVPGDGVLGQFSECHSGELLAANRTVAERRVPPPDTKNWARCQQPLLYHCVWALFF